MVELRESDANVRDFHFAQVDCAANGDLCHQNGVKYYPSIFLYVNGEQFDEYNGKRNLDDLSIYINDNLPAKAIYADDDDSPEGSTTSEGDLVEEEDSFAIQTSAPERPSKGEPDLGGPKLDETRMVVQVADPSTKKTHRDLNPADGAVHAAGLAELDALHAADGAPSFVKFFAPWCGHCKTLAPRWTELASQLKDQVHVYEVDCDQGANKKVCKQEGVKVYPTLKLSVRARGVGGQPGGTE